MCVCVVYVCVSCARVVCVCCVRACVCVCMHVCVHVCMQYVVCTRACVWTPCTLQKIIYENYKMFMNMTCLYGMCMN